MIKELAVNHFSGKNGFRLLNCAQTIIHIFKDRVDFVSESTISDFKKMGLGKAPDGECGMVYAAKFLLQNSGKDEDAADFENFFTDFSGSLKCSEIRKKKRTFCTQCMEETAGYLDKKFS